MLRSLGAVLRARLKQRCWLVVGVVTGSATLTLLGVCFVFGFGGLRALVPTWMKARLGCGFVAVSMFGAWGDKSLAFALVLVLCGSTLGTVVMSRRTITTVCRLAGFDRLGPPSRARPVGSYCWARWCLVNLREVTDP